MPTRRLFRDAWTILRSTSLLWALTLLSAIVPLLPRSPDLLTLNYALLPFAVAFGAFASLAVPRIVSAAHESTRLTLKATCQAVLSTLPRLVGLWLTLVLPLSLLLLCLYLWFYAPHASPPAVTAVIAARYVLIPLLAIIVRLALAGIALHRLTGPKALLNAILIAANNPLSALCILAMTLVASLPHLALVALRGGLPMAIRQLVSLATPVSIHPSPWGYIGSHLIETVLALPILVYVSAFSVLFYVRATQRVAYPWTQSQSPA